jgi:meiosis-specific APC/C activator protein AMA1
LWSINHREIAATFGYANPDHPIRIAVFSWPECKQVVQIPWQEDMRALYAVAYPGGPNDPPSSFASDTATANASNMRRTESGNDDIDILREEFGVIGRNIGFPRWPGRNRPKSEGCIVVAASDETVRFHEVWSETRRGVLGWRGVLGGSDILEGLEGIEKDGGEMIR